MMAAVQRVRQDALSHTSLDALHRELGARMVTFAGWNMPLQYQTGIHGIECLFCLQQGQRTIQARGVKFLVYSLNLVHFVLR